MTFSFEVKMNFEMNFEIELTASSLGTHHLGQTLQVKHHPEPAPEDLCLVVLMLNVHTCGGG